MSNNVKKSDGNTYIVGWEKKKKKRNIMVSSQGSCQERAAKYSVRPDEGAEAV